MYQEKAKEAAMQVGKVLLGKQTQIKEVLLALLAGGHILLEDIPGVGKTTLALAFSRALQMEYKRVQFTPDVMPSDLTGFSIYSREKEAFVYQQGSVFCNLLLADEINRTSPKTQSALLEVMEERKVTVEGVTRKVPEPFVVIATQNPSGSTGTQYLPEAQIDRFMITLSLGYPDYEDELLMAKNIGAENRLDIVEPVLGKETLLEIQKEVQTVFIKEEVYRYILDLVTATRTHKKLERGASPRATIALVKMARASAWYEGRMFVTPKDVRAQFPYVITHRITGNMTSQMKQVSKKQIAAEMIESVQEPPMGEESR